MTRRVRWLALAGAVLICLIALAAAVPEPRADAATGPELILRYAENQPEGYPTTEAAYAFAELVAERTDGRVNVRVYSNGVWSTGALIFLESPSCRWASLCPRCLFCSFLSCIRMTTTCGGCWTVPLGKCFWIR